MRLAATAPAMIALALPAGASATVECGIEEREPAGAASDALRITTSEVGDGVAVVRAGEEIVVSDDRRSEPVACVGGAATVASIDSIELFTDRPENFLYVDLSGNRLAPGASGESEGDPEIELGIDWPAGFLGFGGARKSDLLSFGHRGGELVGQLNLDDDRDVVATSVGGLLVRGQAGNDTITGRGLTQVELRGSVEPIAPLRTFATFEGATGKDNLAGGAKPDILSGGPGDDLILASGGGRDDVDCGGGDDQVFAGPRDKLRHCERVKR